MPMLLKLAKIEVAAIKLDVSCAIYRYRMFAVHSGYHC